MGTRLWRAAALAVAVLLVGSGVAWADNVQLQEINDVAVTNNARTINLLAGSPTSTGKLEFSVGATGGDGDTGCNIDLGETLTVGLTLPAGVTAAPSTMSFTACNQTQAITVSAANGASSGPGAAVITSSDTGGTYNLNPSKFDVVVTHNTPPAVEVTGFTDGQSFELGGVLPTAGCSVTDAEDTSPSAAPVSTPALNAWGLGSVSVTCSYTDGGGLFDSDTKSYSIVDTTDPTIGHGVVPTAPDGEAGWYVTAPTVTFSCSDSGSGIASCLADGATPASSAITLGDGAAQVVGGTATDNAGNTATDSVTLDVDTTDPTIGASIGAPNTNGWYDAPATVSFSCNDTTSGISVCPADETVGEGADQTVSGTAYDVAGNSASDSETGINVDLTDPTVALTGAISDGDSFYFGSVPAQPGCTAEDALSGIDGACAVAGYSTVVGTHTVTASAADLAGNDASASITYTVEPWTLEGFYQPVDMSATNLVKAGSTVPLKFEVFIGPTEVTATTAIHSFTVAKSNCTNAYAAEDAIEHYSTGGTSLRYDATGGQFVQNWKVPSGAGSCYRVTLTTDDGSSEQAFFKTR